MKNNVVIRVDSKVGTVFVFFDLEFSLRIINFLYFENREELCPHLNQLIFSCVICWKCSDYGN